MSVQVALATAMLTLAAPPATRVAVLVDDPGQGTPTVAALESTLQKLGYEVVAAQTSAEMRKVVAPSDILAARLPEGLSVFEADAVLGGTVAYGEPMEIEGVKSLAVSMTVRLIDLGTGQALATFRSDGQGLGAGGPTVRARGAEQAVKLLFAKHGLKGALAKVGPRSGSVTLVVKGLPDRDAWVALQKDVSEALAGAPATERYFSTGLGKMRLGGSKSDKAMAGPDIANLINDNRKLALVVEEVANTRIVARYDRARTVNVKALVLEPKLRNRKKARELGRYLATQLATFEFARAAFQPGRLDRKKGLERAKAGGYDVLIESEVLGRGADAALTLRVVDVKTGRPIHRQQRVLTKDGDFGAAKQLVAALETELPNKIVEHGIETGGETGSAVASEKLAEDATGANK